MAPSTSFHYSWPLNGGIPPYSHWFNKTDIEMTIDEAYDAAGPTDAAWRLTRVLSHPPVTPSVDSDASVVPS